MQTHGEGIILCNPLCIHWFGRNDNEEYKVPTVSNATYLVYLIFKHVLWSRQVVVCIIDLTAQDD